MDEIENNLKELKKDYHTIRYPGDLGSDVPLDIAAPAVAGRIGAFLALAAALALGVTCYIIWTPGKSDDNNIAVKNPENNSVAVAPHKNTTEEVATTVTQSLIVSIPAREETSEFEAPSWADVTPTNAYTTDVSASMPYQSFAVPSINEIDDAITEQKKQTSTKQG